MMQGTKYVGPLTLLTVLLSIQVFFFLSGANGQGLVGYQLVEHSILVYRQFLSGYLLNFGNLESLFNQHFEEVNKRVWFVIIWQSTAYWLIGVFCPNIYRWSAVSSSEFSLIGILKKFIKGFGFYYSVEHSIGLSTIFVWIFEPRQSVLESLV